MNTLNRPGKRKRNRRTGTGASGPTPSAPSSPSPATTASTCSRDPDGTPQAQAHQPRPPVPDRLGLRRDHQGRRPRRTLLAKKRGTGGRNSYGRKTARHRGGGHKQRYRVVDFRRNKDGVEAKVVAIEYDPNRTCRILLLHYLDGEKAYILAPKGVKVGDRLQSGQGSEIRPGNALPLRYIPVGTTIHNVELRPGGGGKMARSAGSSVQLVAKEGDFATLRLPSHRDAPRADRLPRHRRRGRQRRARAHQDRQGRPQPLEGRQARRPAASP